MEEAIASNVARPSMNHCTTLPSSVKPLGGANEPKRWGWHQPSGGRRAAFIAVTQSLTLEELLVRSFIVRPQEDTFLQWIAQWGSDSTGKEKWCIQNYGARSGVQDWTTRKLTLSHQNIVKPTSSEWDFLLFYHIFTYNICKLPTTDILLMNHMFLYYVLHNDQQSHACTWYIECSKWLHR